MSKENIIVIESRCSLLRSYYLSFKRLLVNVNIVPKGGSFHQSAHGCKNGLVMLVHVIFALKDLFMANAVLL